MSPTTSDDDGVSPSTPTAALLHGAPHLPSLSRPDLQNTILAEAISVQVTSCFSGVCLVRFGFSFVS